MTQVIPIGQNVMILPTPKETTINGFLIPDSAIEHPVSGTAVAVGPDAKQVKVDQIVIFPQNFGAPIQVEGKDYIVLPEAKILSIIIP